MSLFDSVPILPQQAAGIGLRGSNGPAGAVGPAGPNGAPGASGSFTLVSRTFTLAEIVTLNVPTPIVLTADVPGFLQVVVGANFEINKTHLTGAGGVPSWLIRYTGTAINAMTLGVMDLGNTRNYGTKERISGASFLGGSVGVGPGIGGLGLQTQWSATYAPSTFSTPDPGAVMNVIIALIPLRF